MNIVEVPEQITYIGAFLTFSCQLHCSYCINRHNGLKPRKPLTADQWIAGLNRLRMSKELNVPITLQGGEPSAHIEFLEILKGLDEGFHIDLLTNLEFDITGFMKTISPARLRRDAPYASIRASYHPEFSDLDGLLRKIKRMQEGGYSIGLFAVDHPYTDIRTIRQKALKNNIDFRTKEFLGILNGKLHGLYNYAGAVNGAPLRKVECRTTELLIAPDGHIHRCHRDLYQGENAVGHILEDFLTISFPFRQCNRYGECNPCDIKIKNNRFQEFGHCSVIINN